MTTEPINPYANILWSRDVIERIKELQAIPSDERTQDETKELNTLLCLEEDASDATDWKSDALLIRNTYFKEYVKEIADACGILDTVDKRLLSYSAWERIIHKMQRHYIDVEFMGQTFWVRR